MRIVKVNEIGRRIGEDHPAAKLTDAEVAILLRLREEERWSYDRLKAIFELSKSQVRNICKGTKRSHTVAGHRAVHPTPQAEASIAT